MGDLGLKAGSYRGSNPYFRHRGREISVRSVELELSNADSDRLAVFATARVTAKLLGLSPGEQEIEVFFELEGRRFFIDGATVFDVDLHPSGETSVQITGDLVELE